MKRYEHLRANNDSWQVIYYWNTCTKSTDCKD